MTDIDFAVLVVAAVLLFLAFGGVVTAIASRNQK